MESQHEQVVEGSENADIYAPQTRFLSPAWTTWVSSCHKNSSRQEIEKDPLGLTTLYVPPASEQVVANSIFVHGLNGGSYSTWTTGNYWSSIWPKDWLPEDEAFRGVRIHTFGYSGSLQGKTTSSISEVVRSLLISIHNALTIPRNEEVGVLLL